MCGRAGRGGCQARAHLLVIGDDTKIKDATLKSLCTDRENCFRAAIITSIGGTVEQQNTLCCMVCNPSAFTDGGRLDVMQVGSTPPRKRRRVAVRRVTETTTQAVRMQLKAERTKYITEHPSLAVLGAQFLCPDSVIDNICSSLKFIAVPSDMDVFCLRRELKDRFFNVLLAVVNS